MQNSYLPNFSYLFVPFTTEKNVHFPDFYKKLGANGWISEKIENRYLHRYVVEKTAIDDADTATHFRLDKSFAEARGLRFEENLYSLEEKEYKGEKNTKFNFTFDSVELFAFNTSICILAFKLRFEDNDPFRIAAAQYYLRKISTEKIYRNDLAAGTAGESFIDISSRLLKDAAGDIPLDFFFYAARNNEKANFLTYIDVPYQADYKKELFYLKWCYNDTFDYFDDCGESDNEIYRASSSAVWGISSSAAVCLVYKSEALADFVENIFQKNFQKQYLLAYILLLHQKYMMYLFLTKMSAGIEGNLEQLKKYKEALYDFEKHYMFSYISEVPQYQRFYDKVRKMFALDALFEDVQEPLMQLTEIKNRKEQEDAQNREQRINTTLTTLSLLTVISALTDSTGLPTDWHWFLPTSPSKIIQLILFGGVLAFSIYTFIRLIFLKKR